MTVNTGNTLIFIKYLACAKYCIQLFPYLIFPPHTQRKLFLTFYFETILDSENFKNSTEHFGYLHSFPNVNILQRLEGIMIKTWKSALVQC